MRCSHFAMTGIKLKVKHTPEEECRICPLRNEKGDCIKDIMEEKGLEMEAEVSQIWERFWRNKYAKDR